jgi:DNA mismatch endonuclease (patch repair protein)
MGLRYRVDYSLPFDRRRKADLVFPRQKIAVFIDGCFWHGCPQHYVAPKAHGEYWRAKVTGNAARDAETTRLLTELGWTVLRFWEHEDPAATAQRIVRTVQPQRAAGSK